MPGYVIDVGGIADPDQPGSESAVELPSDALVVVVDSVKQLLRGLVHVEDLRTRLTEHPQPADVLAAARSLVDDSVVRALVDGEFTFEEGTVLLVDGELGILPGGEPWSRLTSEAGRRAVAFRSMGSIPGLPTTSPGVRMYECRSGHKHLLRNAAGSPCPTPQCGLPLQQL